MSHRSEQLLDQWIEDSLQGREPQHHHGAVEGEVTPQEVDRVAAALHLALVAPQVKAMPSSLRDKVEQQARLFSFPARPAAPKLRAVPEHPAPDREERSGSSAWIAWSAAAASLLFALWTWSARGGAGSETPVATTPAESRAELLASASDVLRLDWTATEDPTAVGASGDVVWSDSEQAGYMTFRSLEANDPTETQYQLWIFDPARPDEHPVDGGVFDVPAGATEVVVPIDPKLGVTNPKLFAVTVEEPGGVVVSKRERIVLLAQQG